MTKARDLGNAANSANTAISSTELGYLDGVTSSVQTQLDAKLANALIDAKGDVLTATADNTPARLAVGANDTVLTADSSTATGLKWATPAAGGMTSLATGTLSGASVTISAISGLYKDLCLVITNRIHATANKAGAIRLNGDSASNYTIATIYSSDSAAGITTPDTTFMRTAGDAQTSGTSYSIEVIKLYDYTNTSIHKIADVNSYTSATSAVIRNMIAFYKSTSAITSITILAESGNLTSGNYVLYGVK